MLTYNAYDKGILPEPGGLGSQPLKFLPMMALLNSRTNIEMQDEQKRKEEAGKPGKKSLTEEYLELYAEADPLSMADPKYAEAIPQIAQRGNPKMANRSPDGFAAVPGLVKPRSGIGRN